MPASATGTAVEQLDVAEDAERVQHGPHPLGSGVSERCRVDPTQRYADRMLGAAARAIRLPTQTSAIGSRYLLPGALHTRGHGRQMARRREAQTHEADESDRGDPKFLGTLRSPLH